jgi:hypothetical protein
MADERGLVAALAVALAPTPVHWGFAPFEASTTPPGLPLVVVQRLTYSTGGYEDMCEGAYVGDTVLVVDAWALGYEQGRALCAAVRDAVTEVGDWRLQSETDLFEPVFRAWRIQGQWLAAATAPT